MNVQEIFIRADERLKEVVDQIKDEQWDMPMPAEFATYSNPEEVVTLRNVINSHAYDEAWIPDMLAGKTMEEAGAEKFDGDLLGQNPKENYAALVKKALTAVRDLDDLERTVHYTYGDYPAREALGHVLIYRGLRAYSLAEVIGIDSDLPPELVQGLWDVIAPQAEDLRAMGVFAPKVEVPETAPLQDRLLGLTGQQP